MAIKITHKTSKDFVCEEKPAIEDFIKRIRGDVVVELCGEPYERMADIDTRWFDCTIEGTLNEVLNHIADKYSYPADEEDTLDEMMMRIIDCNGDGCAYIARMIICDKSTGELMRVI